jgi:hypothetical protein
LGIVLPYLHLCGQEESSIKLKFQPALEKVSLELGKTFYINGNTDSITFYVLRFYISGIQLLLNCEVVWRDTSRCYLLDAENEKSYNISLKVPRNLMFNEFNFSCGIDSTTNVSGAFGGDLDPTNGMYWTWQSGYINAKLEGKSSLCKSKDASFQLHLGGYQFPNNALQRVNLPIASGEMLVNLELLQFINNINIAEKHHIMSPSPEAVVMSKTFSNSFKISR